MASSSNAVDLTFTEEETTRLFKRFIRIDKDQNNELEIQEFMALNKVADNPLASRFIQHLDTNQNGMVDFGEFLAGLSAFGKYGKIEDKLMFIFRLYDANDDGFISNGDLFNTLKIMVGENLANGPLQQVVDKTIREADLDGDGRLSYDEFKTFVESRNRELIEKIDIKESI